MFSKRVEEMRPSPIRKFATHSEAARLAGKNVIPLNIGQPDIETPQAYFKALASIEEQVIAYSPSEGIPELREAFAAYFKKSGLPYEYDELLITNGGSEALLYAFAALCDDGDEIMMFEPFYSNYLSISQVIGAKVNPVPTDPENNYRIPSYEEIAMRVTPKTKAVIVTNPSNPTGLVLKAEEMETIKRVCVEFGLFLISDEVYREFTYDNAVFRSFAMYPELLSRLIVIDSVSKRFSACGVRVGCIATKNREFLSHVLKLCQSRLAVPFAEQIAAVSFFKESEEEIEKVRLEYKARRDVCVEVLSQMKEINFKTPEGAFYFILKLPVEDSDDFTGWLLSDFDVDGETIMLCPANGCYVTEGGGKDEVRISYCISQDKLRRAMVILEQGLRAYSRR
ncbi:MAG: pyridoxal phosphate-dependent aminotransferase [Eubacteriaceae bacterium]|nr:pyridoxal phosphate-dependent aminotransferase [Eubacteriaceae bacterium]